jgi:hypothetical protein
LRQEIDRHLPPSASVEICPELLQLDARLAPRSLDIRAFLVSQRFVVGRGCEEGAPERMADAIEDNRAGVNGLLRQLVHEAVKVVGEHE